MAICEIFSMLLPLNATFLPYVIEELITCWTLCTLDEYKNQNKEMVILDAALLVESDYLNFIDKLLVVICNEDIQIERIKQRDNCSKEEALSRIKSQMSQEEKVKYADYIIDNSGTIEELRKKAFAFMDYIKEKCCE